MEQEFSSSQGALPSSLRSDAEIGALLESVKASTGPDHDLDFWLHYRLIGMPEQKPPIVSIERGEGEWRTTDANGSRGWLGYHVAPFYTASVDAALVLVERALGLECDWLLKTTERPTGERDEFLCNINDHDSGYGATAPLAVLAALLAALSDGSNATKTGAKPGDEPS